MEKLSFLRPGQEISADNLNKIIKAINSSIIEKPEYEKMVEDLRRVINDNTKKLESFLLEYGDIVDNTPNMRELLIMVAGLRKSINTVTPINADAINSYLNSKLTKQTVDGEDGLYFYDGVNYVKVAVGIEGPAGIQGIQGQAGVDGRDGENAIPVNIRGYRETTPTGNANVEDDWSTTVDSSLSLNDAYFVNNAGNLNNHLFILKPSSIDTNYWQDLGCFRGETGPQGLSQFVFVGYTNTQFPTYSQIILESSPDVTANNILSARYLAIGFSTSENINSVEKWYTIRRRADSVVFNATMSNDNTYINNNISVNKSTTTVDSVLTDCYTIQFPNLIKNSYKRTSDGNTILTLFNDSTIDLGNLKGDTGEQGTSVMVKGAYTTEEHTDAQVTAKLTEILAIENKVTGDAWFVDGYLYLYTEPDSGDTATINNFNNLGQLKGYAGNSIRSITTETNTSDNNYLNLLITIATNHNGTNYTDEEVIPFNKVLLSEGAIGNIINSYLKAPTDPDDQVENNYVAFDAENKLFVPTVVPSADSVSTTAIQNSAITENKIAGGAITNSKIATGTIAGSKLENYSITHDKLGSYSVNTNNFALDAVCPKANIASTTAFTNEEWLNTFSDGTPEIELGATYLLSVNDQNGNTHTNIVCCLGIGQNFSSTNYGIFGSSYRLFRFEVQCSGGNPAIFIIDEYDNSISVPNGINYRRIR